MYWCRINIRVSYPFNIYIWGPKLSSLLQFCPFTIFFWLGTRSAGQRVSLVCEGPSNMQGSHLRLQKLYPYLNPNDFSQKLILKCFSPEKPSLQKGENHSTQPHASSTPRQHLPRPSLRNAGSMAQIGLLRFCALCAAVRTPQKQALMGREGDQEGRTQPLVQSVCHSTVRLIVMPATSPYLIQ